MRTRRRSSALSIQPLTDRSAKGYRLEQLYKTRLSNSEILAVWKILLDSRAFTKKEMLLLLDKLVERCVPQTNQKAVMDLISNEEFHYVGTRRHHTVFIDKLGLLDRPFAPASMSRSTTCATKDEKIWCGADQQPVAIRLSEYDFYLTAFIDDKEVQENFDVLNDAFPTIYRLDRIKKLKLLDEKFHISYSSRFEEGEFRKRIQFMYGGKLQKVKFEYSGTDVDAVLDRLPTARIIKEEDGKYVIEAEVFGKGIETWLEWRQRENVKIMDMKI